MHSVHEETEIGRRLLSIYTEISACAQCPLNVIQSSQLPCEEDTITSSVLGGLNTCLAQVAGVTVKPAAFSIPT